VANGWMSIGSIVPQAECMVWHSYSFPLLQKNCKLFQIGEYKRVHSPDSSLATRRLAKESWPGYHDAHYEANDEGYKNEDDERLRIDEHRSYPFRAGPDVLEKEQSIIRDDALQKLDGVRINAYWKCIGSSVIHETTQFKGMIGRTDNTNQTTHTPEYSPMY